MQKTTGNILFVQGNARSPHDYNMTVRTLTANGFNVTPHMPDWDSVGFNDAVGLILASKSTLSKEGLAYPIGRDLAERDFPGQQEEIARFSLTTLADNVSLSREQLAVLTGEKECEQYPHMAELARTIAGAFGAEPEVVPGAPHFIDYSQQYIEAVAVAALRIREANHY